MFLPKVIGLLFVAASSFITTDEAWQIAAKREVWTSAPFMLFQISCLYLFIRLVLLRGHRVPSKTLHRRATGVFCMTLVESFLLVLFLTSLWGKVMAERVESVKACTNSFLPNWLALHVLDQVFPSVYPGIVLFWTVQVAFIGIVLQLFLTRESLVEKGE